MLFNVAGIDVALGGLGFTIGGAGHKYLINEGVTLEKSIIKCLVEVQ